MHAWSLRSDRAWLVRGPIAILEIVRGWFRYVSFALGQPVFDSIETWTRFYREALRRDFLRRLLFVKTFMPIFTDFQALISS